MEPLLETEVWSGRTIADLISAEYLLSLGGRFVSAIAILCVGLLLARFIRLRIERLAQRHHRLDATLFGFLANVVWYVIFALTALILLNTFGVQTTSVVALFGAAGLAVGLALQGTLSNVAAGVMLVFFRPIKLGDFVQINDQMGTVRSINLNFTELATVGNVQVIVPNSSVWGNTIVNYSHYPTRRAEWTFGVSYGSDLKVAEETILATIMADPRSMTEPEPFIQVNNLGDFSVDFLVRVWVDRNDYFAYQADMTRKVKEALDAAGVEIPFPTRTVLSTGAPAA